jgi:acetyltransferase-like isoleucine patch superfamily enzyme
MRAVTVPVTDVNSDRAFVTAWHAADREPVAGGEILAQVETSKSVVDVEAPGAGLLLRAVGTGEQFGLGEPIAHLFDTTAELEAFAARPREPVAAGAGAGSGAVRATAPAMRRAEELGVALAELDGHGALITVAMVEAAARPAPDPEDLPEPLATPPGVERLALVGAGLGATQVLDILGRDEGRRAVAVLDDDASRWGREVGGVPVVGGSARLTVLHAAGAIDAAVICISTSIAARTRLRRMCEDAGVPLANAIHPTAWVAADASLGAGNVVCAFCHVGAGARIGDNNFLSAYNSFEHHNVLGSDISTGPGCVTSGLVTIGDRVRLGTGIFVEPHVELGDDVQVASGAIIVSSVPAGHAVKRRVVTTAVVPGRAVG